MNLWDQRFAEPGFAYGVEPNDFLREVSPRLRVGRVLCLGEGEGRNAVFLAQRGHAVTAVDASAVGLEKARGLAQSRGVTITTVHADLASFNIEPAGWDTIVSIWCHLPSALRRRVHAQVRGGLAPGGAYVVEAYTPEQLRFSTGGPRDIDLLLTRAELEADFGGLSFAVIRQLEREVREGRFHQGRSAVVQALVAQGHPPGRPAGLD